jgi:hypothetical protein
MVADDAIEPNAFVAGRLDLTIGGVAQDFADAPAGDKATKQTSY